MKVRAAGFVCSARSARHLPRDRLSEIAFSGRSNVGKSSLINVLLNRKNLAKTSSTPGKTRSLNCYSVNDALYFVDLPGYGFARVSKAERAQWERFVEPYLMGRATLRGLVQLVDARHDPMETDLRMVEWLLYHQKPFLIALTKSDKLSRHKLKAQCERTIGILSEMDPNLSTVLFSTKTRMGRDQIWRWIEQVV